MLPLHTHGKLRNFHGSMVAKVLSASEALDGLYGNHSVFIDMRGEDIRFDETALERAGFAGLLRDHDPGKRSIPTLHSLNQQDVVAAGDVLRIRESGHVSVLYRRGANSNTLFVTEQCNSKCLMCSQPPMPADDSWRISELMELIALIDRDLPVLGFTGGEPTLLGDNLERLIAAVRTHLPTTRVHILTNGRRFSDPLLVDRVAVGRDAVQWAIPLYADTASLHDYVVQSHGAFDETMNGIYNLAERGNAIEIRMVLSKVTVPRLQEYAEFIWRNLPFVTHVALMGLEPMGFAKMNRDALWVDPVEYADGLADTAWFLNDRGIPASIYNLPLCVLPPGAWPVAQQSISDWKNVFPPECSGCAVKDRCAGFFVSAGSAWRSRGIRPILKEEAA